MTTGARTDRGRPWCRSRAAAGRDREADQGAEYGLECGGARSAALVRTTLNVANRTQKPFSTSSSPPSSRAIASPTASRRLFWRATDRVLRVEDAIVARRSRRAPTRRSSPSLIEPTRAGKRSVPTTTRASVTMPPTEVETSPASTERSAPTASVSAAPERRAHGRAPHRCAPDERARHRVSRPPPPASPRRVAQRRSPRAPGGAREPGCARRRRRRVRRRTLHSRSSRVARG